MTISAEEIAIWIKRRIDQEQPLISLSPSMACDVVASLTDMKTGIEKRDARIAALEAQLAGEREECAKVADKRASHACNECERLSGTDPETGAYECSFEVSGRGCLCNERMEEAEAIAAALDAALKE